MIPANQNVRLIFQLYSAKPHYVEKSNLRLKFHQNLAKPIFKKNHTLIHNIARTNKHRRM